MKYGTRQLIRTAILPLLLTALALPLWSEGPAEDESRVRTVVQGEHSREEALVALKQQLFHDPDDSDARTLYGTMLSWEGQYDEARAQLEQVLARIPNHRDALPALINVELWSNHPDRADVLARQGLEQRPDDVILLLADAHALRNLDQPDAALKVLDQVLSLEPGNQDAKNMRRRISLFQRRWEFQVNHTYDFFSDGRNGQHETSLSLRGPVGNSSLIARVNRADRFSLVSYQTEMDFYPHFRSGTYGYLNAGYSADANLYPKYRLGAELFQSLKKGFEVSGGYRRLSFGSGVDIYTFSVSKYYRDWLFTTRGFVTPGSPGTSGTALISARYFLGSEGLHDYIEFRSSFGASPAQAQTLQDIQILNSRRYSVEFNKVLWGGWSGSFGGGAGQQQRVGLSDLWQYTTQGAVYFRF
ncbi:MAG TPA: YaiO family outer membrane beta-barrel protein [Candidatus Angelobacter sp.]|nr:YaiO family outer membrane beta-barrel protein [Candidatus Angelobacter sp.]